MAAQAKQQETRALAPIEHLAPSRLPITQAMMGKIGVDDATWRVLTDQIFPSARTVEGIKLAVDYCRSRNLDIMKKPVHIVPVYSSILKRMIETVWPSITEIRITATRTGKYAGIDKATFGPMIEQEFIDAYEDERDPRNNREIKRTITYPEWCEIVVHKFVQGEKCSFNATVYWLEAYATVSRNSEMPNEMWRKRARGQIEKCAEAAALRRAFPEELGGQYVAEEMEGKTIEGEITGYGRTPPSGAGDAAARQAEALRAKARQMAEPAKAVDTASDGVTGTVVDVAVDEIDAAAAGEDAEPFDFEEFAARLGEAPDEAIVKEVWEHFGIDELFADNPHDMTIALKAKQHRLRQIKDTLRQAQDKQGGAEL